MYNFAIGPDRRNHHQHLCKPSTFCSAPGCNWVKSVLPHPYSGTSPEVARRAQDATVPFALRPRVRRHPPSLPLRPTVPCIIITVHTERAYNRYLLRKEIQGRTARDLAVRRACLKRHGNPAVDPADTNLCFVKSCASVRASCHLRGLEHSLREIEI